MGASGSLVRCSRGRLCIGVPDKPRTSTQGFGKAQGCLGEVGLRMISPRSALQNPALCGQTTISYTEKRPPAEVAELVDAPDSKSGEGNLVRVRFSPSAPNKIAPLLREDRGRSAPWNPGKSGACARAATRTAKNTRPHYRAVKRSAEVGGLTSDLAVVSKPCAHRYGLSVRRHRSNLTPVTRKY